MNRVDIELANYTIAKDVAETLNKHYPCHAWCVNANIETGIVTIFNLRLSGKWGFYINMDDLVNDSSMKIIINAGGEMLERYNLSRGELKQSEYDDLSYDFKGEAIQS